MKTTEVLIITTGQGHASLAEVVATELELNNFAVATFKYFPKVGLHLFLHRYAPGLMRLLSKPISNKYVVSLARFVLQYRFQKMVEKQIKKYQPKVVISSFYLLNPAIEKLKEKYHFYFINLITDPRTMILLNPSPLADVNFTFDEHQATKIREMYPQAKTKVVGWLVKHIFEEEYDQAQAKKALKLKPELPVLLLTSGSLGNASPVQLLPKLLSIKKPVQVVLICGSNELLKTMAENFKQTLLKNELVALKIVGFTQTMEQYMRAADLVIGKAGPNTLFEATATRTPFMSISYGGEQEKGNQELIIGYNLGLVETNLDKIWLKLAEFIDQPELLTAFDLDLLKMKKHNLKAKQFLIEEVKQLIKT